MTEITAHAINNGNIEYEQTSSTYDKYLDHTYSGSTNNIVSNVSTVVSEITSLKLLLLQSSIQLKASAAENMKLARTIDDYLSILNQKHNDINSNFNSVPSQIQNKDEIDSVENSLQTSYHTWREEFSSSIQPWSLFS
jgi:hypothetical protein